MPYGGVACFVTWGVSVWLFWSSFQGLYSIVWLRKGLAAHISILDAYISGLTLEQKDEIIVVDLMPNRCDV